MKSKNNDIIQQRFRQNGFVFIPGFLTQKEVADLQTAMDNLIHARLQNLPPEHVFYEDKNDSNTLKQVQSLYSYEPLFNDTMFDGKFPALASLLLQDRVTGKNMQYFNKPPRIGKPTPAHQDGFYFMLEPCEAITIWLALEDVDEENGCVRYVKASHLKGMRPHAKTQTLGFSQGITDYGEEDLSAEVFFATKAGDILAHHALTIHRADANNSADRSRKAMGFIYYAASARENTGAKEVYQQQLAAELKTKSLI